MRTCSECGQAKEERDFYLDKRRGGFQRRCKRCVIACARRWQDRNPDRAKEIAHKWYAENSRRRKGYSLKRFGMTVEQYEELFSTQNGLCAICGKPPNGKKLAVDHCHSSNRIRGLLCNSCNAFLGLLEAMPDFPEKARAYLGISAPPTPHKRSRPMSKAEQMRAMRESK